MRSNSSRIALGKEHLGLAIVLTENTLIRRLISERLHKIYGARPVLYSGKACVQEAVEGLSTSDLFGEPAPVWIELPEKLSAKQWSEYAQQLSAQRTSASGTLYFSPGIRSSWCSRVQSASVERASDCHL